MEQRQKGVGYPPLGAVEVVVQVEELCGEWLELMRGMKKSGVLTGSGIPVNPQGL